LHRDARHTEDELSTILKVVSKPGLVRYAAPVSSNS
jgi:hypothetical protein